MDEIAEMMLEGMLCESCGVYIGDSVGYPRFCSSCENETSGLKSKTERRLNNFKEQAQKLKNFNIKSFTLWHYRITRKSSNVILDVYPTKLKWHRVDLGNDARGRYNNLKDLIQENFNA